MATMTETILFHKDCYLNESLMILAPCSLIARTIVQQGSTIDKEVQSDTRTLTGHVKVTSSTILLGGSMIPSGTILKVMKVSSQNLDPSVYVVLSQNLSKNFDEITSIILRVTEDNQKTIDYTTAISELEDRLNDKTRDYDEADANYKTEIQYLLNMNRALKEQTEDMEKKQLCDAESVKSILANEKSNLDKMRILQSDLETVRSELSHYTGSVKHSDIQSLLKAKGISDSDASNISRSILSPETWKCSKNLEQTVELLDRINYEIEASNGIVKKFTSKSDLSSVVADLETKLRRKQQQNASLKSLIQDQNEQKQILQGLIDDEEREKETLLSMIQDDKILMARRDDEYADLESILSFKNSENLRLLEQNQMLRGITNDDAERLEHAAEELEMSKADHLRARFVSEMKDRRIGMVQEQNDHLRTALTQKQDKLHGLRKIIEEVEDDNMELRDEKYVLEGIVSDDAERIQHFTRKAGESEAEMERRFRNSVLIAQGIERINRRIQKKGTQIQQIMSDDPDVIDGMIKEGIEKLASKYCQKSDELQVLKSELQSEVKENEQLSKRFEAMMIEEEFDFDTQNTSISKQRSELIMELVKTQTTYEELENQIKISREKLADIDSQMDETKAKILELDQLISENEKFEVDTNIDIVRLKNEIAHDTKRHFHEKKGTKVNFKEELEHELHSKTDMLRVSKENKERLNVKRDEFSSHLLELQDIADTSRQQLNLLEREFEDLNEEKQSLERDITDISHITLKVLHNERNHYKNKYQCNESELLKLKELLGEYEERHEQLECALRNSREIHDDLSEEIRQFHTKQMELLKTMKSSEERDELRTSYLEALSKSHESEFKDLRSKIDANERDIAQFKMDLCVCAEEKERLQCVIQSMKENISTVTDQFNKEKQVLFIKLNDYQSKCKSLGDALEQQRTKRTVVEKERDATVTKLSDLTEHFDEVSNQNKILARERSQITKKLEKAMDIKESDGCVFGDIKKVEQMSEVVEELSFVVRKLSEDLKTKVEASVYLDVLEKLNKVSQSYEQLVAEHNEKSALYEKELKTTQMLKSHSVELDKRTLECERMAALHDHSENIIHGLMDEISELKQKMKLVNVDLAETKALNSELQEHGEKIVEELESSLSVYRSSEESKWKANSVELERLNRIIADQELHIADQEQRISNYEHEHTSIKHLLDDCDATIREKDEDIAALKDILVKREHDIEDLRSSVPEVQQSYDEITIQLKRFSAIPECHHENPVKQVDMIYESYKHSLTHLDKTLKENDALSKMIDELSRENESLKKEKTHKKGRGTTAGAVEQKENEELKLAIADIMDKSDAARETSKLEIASLHSEIEQLRGDLIASRIENEQIKKVNLETITQMDKHNRELTGINEHLSRSNLNLTKELEFASIRMNELQQKHFEIQSSHAEVQMMNVDLQSKNEMSAEFVKHLEVELFEKTQNYIKSLEQIEELEHHLVEMSSKYESSLVEIDELRSGNKPDDYVRRVEQHVEDLEIQLHESLEHNMDLTEQLRVCSDALKTCSASEEQIQRRCETLERNLAKLTEEHQKTENSADDARRLSEHIIQLQNVHASEKSAIVAEKIAVEQDLAKIRKMDIISLLTTAIQGIFEQEDQHRHLMEEFQQRKITKEKFDAAVSECKKLKRAYKTRIINYGIEYNTLASIV